MYFYLMKKRIIYLFVVVASLMACQDKQDDRTDLSKAYPAIIAGKAFSYDASGVGSIWNRGETIGVYMLAEGSDRIITPYSNIRYSANKRNDQDYFIPQSNDSLLYYSPEGERVDIAAYYPYMETRDDSLVAINLINQKNIPSTGLLYSRISSLNKDARKARLNLHPVLSKLSFKFRVTDGMNEDDLNGLGIVLKGFPSSGYFNAVRGSFRQHAVYLDISLITRKTSMTLPLTSGETSLTANGFVMPTFDTTGYQVMILLPALGKNKSYLYEVKQSIKSLQGGTEYRFDTTIAKDGLDIKVQSSPIINWEEGGTINGDGQETQSLLFKTN